MARIIGPVATALLGVAALSIIVVGVVGCAMSAPADTTPDLDPSLPGIDAGSDPHPAQGTPGTQANSGENVDGSTGGGMEAGSKTVAPDAAPVDAAPPTPKPSAGEVLITEVMYTTNTPEPASEWIELYNTATSPRSLGGLVLKDGGGRTHLISAAVTIAPASYIVLARSKAGAIAAKVPASVIAYEYGLGLSDSSGVLLANGATGGISLVNGAVTVASVAYGGWFSQSGGASIQLKTLDASLAIAKTDWCLSSAAWAIGSDKGTPGAAGDCP